MQYILHTLLSSHCENCGKEFNKLFYGLILFQLRFYRTRMRCDAMLTTYFIILKTDCCLFSVVYQMVRRKWVLVSKEKFFREDFIQFNFLVFCPKLQSFCEFISKFWPFSGQVRLVTLFCIVTYVLKCLLHNTKWFKHLV